MGFFDFLKSKTNKEKVKDDFSNVSSKNKVIITSPYEPTIDVQSIDGVSNYIKKISQFTLLELSIELSNVMAAKHNKMLISSTLGSFSENQKVVTDLTDKAFLICCVLFGKEKIDNYSNQDNRVFNQLVNDIDKEVATLDLEPAAHGKKIIDKIYRVIGK